MKHPCALCGGRLKYPCELCGVLRPVDRLIYSRWTGNRYCRDWVRCDHRRALQLRRDRKELDEHVMGTA